MNITNEQFTKGVMEYHRERDEFEMDLISEVRNVLFKNNLNTFAYDNDRLIKMASDKNPDVQRHFLNRYWNFQLATASCDDTFEARFSLIPNGNVSDWLKLFEEKVIPVCVKYQLPK